MECHQTSDARLTASDSFGIFTNTLAAYYGIARIALDRVRFDEIAPDARTVDPDAVTRLLLKFTDGRCDRLAPDHYMSATVSGEVLTRALNRGNLTRTSLQSPEPCFLPLAGDEHVMGIRGIHRHKAAQQYFSDDQWWVVRLYDERVLSDTARRSMAWSSVMAAPRSSGEAYRQIRLAHHRQDWDWKMEWENAVRPAYLQSDMSRLQTGPEHQPLRDALDQLLCFPGLWMDLHMPLFRGLGALCCMESLVSSLHVVEVRLSHILYGLNPHHLDVGRIRFLQGRCPALSDRDRREIETYMTQKRIFPSVVDGEERECLKQRLLAQNTIILSLRSWKDAITHYLKPGASILKPLFNLSFHGHRARSERVRSSIQREARASFRPGRVPATRPSSGSAHEDFWDAYRRLSKQVSQDIKSLSTLVMGVGQEDPGRLMRLLYPFITVTESKAADTCHVQLTHESYQRPSWP
ncbi:hypothetical protein TCE0_047f17662 [Talaromyces pinophilus]|uniref:Uncharacterized protein n=1 Tax=Talaromyces pinophilus TaxID=128442 RepID=A0A0B8MYH8_TALPI|nr:hypothetical protein TCE0_047f17662 [Talaromyces pinophilus]